MLKLHKIMVNGQNNASHIVTQALRESAYFECEPLPGDDYEIRVKPEYADLLNLTEIEFDYQYAKATQATMQKQIDEIHG